jgi:hypothetical protein
VEEQAGSQQASVRELTACGKDLKTVLSLERWLKKQPRSRVSKQLHEKIQRWLNQASADGESVEVRIDPEAKLRAVAAEICRQDKFENDLVLDEPVSTQTPHPSHTGLSLSANSFQRSEKAPKRKRKWF